VRAVVQRTKCSKVVVDHKTCGEIGAGLMVLLGIKKGDTEKEAQYMMDKIINLRIFPDEEGKMNRSLLDMGGELLLVSQFTLYGDARKGRRPGFSEAALPKEAMALYKYSIDYLQSLCPGQYRAHKHACTGGGKVRLPSLLPAWGILLFSL
jgi:D-tyrosyl-tRNA(Tyr) deacylase